MSKPNNVTKLDIPGRFDRPARHVEIRPSLGDRLADFLSQGGFALGFWFGGVAGGLFTAAAAWVWSWFL
jgi:hypothetical protein